MPLKSRDSTRRSARARAIGNLNIIPYSVVAKGLERRLLRKNFRRVRQFVIYIRYSHHVRHFRVLTIAGLRLVVCGCRSLALREQTKKAKKESELWTFPFQGTVAKVWHRNDVKRLTIFNTRALVFVCFTCTASFVSRAYSLR